MAVSYGMITAELAERWLHYRDVCNHRAHDYGVNFAEETIRASLKTPDAALLLPANILIYNE